MAGPKYLLKSKFEPSKALIVGGRPVIEQREELIHHLDRLGKPTLAVFFAIPLISYGNDAQPPSVSWYCDAAGDPVPITQLQADVRESCVNRLHHHLVMLEPLLDDPAGGLLLAHALIVPRMEDILCMGDVIVLTNWGIAPDSVSDDPAELNAHYARLMGSISPFRAPIRERAVKMATPTPGDGSAAFRQAASSPPNPVLPPSATPPAQRDVARPAVFFYSLLIILSVAVVAIAAGYHLGWRSLVLELQGQGRSSLGLRDAEAMVATQTNVNEGLRRQIAEAESALSRNVCTQDNPAGLPTAPSAIPVQRPAGPGTGAFQGNLADLLDRSVVLILTEADGGVGFGTGFVVGPDLVVTNAHVVDIPISARIMVTSKFLHAVIPAQLVMKTQKQDPFDPDFAVLRVAGISGLTALQLTTRMERLEAVVAAGYPGVILTEDEGFRRLLKGDSSTIPDSNLTSGDINSIQADIRGARIIHTASIAKGNSGGPLTDRCGRVVGINTLISMDASQLTRVNFAQAATSLASYLKANQVEVPISDEPCRPPSPAPAAGPRTP